MAQIKILTYDLMFSLALVSEVGLLNVLGLQIPSISANLASNLESSPTTSLCPVCPPKVPK